MSTSRYRAWHFAHPDFALADPDTAEGPQLARDGSNAGLSVSMTGGIEMVEESDSVRQAILILLTTLPGERVMRPDYGCELDRLMFSPNDDTTAGLAIHFVGRALARWEPRIQVLHLDAGRNASNPARLDIVLEYRVRATQQTDQVTVSLNLAGESS